MPAFLPEALLPQWDTGTQFNKLDVDRLVVIFLNVAVNTYVTFKVLM